MRKESIGLMLLLACTTPLSAQEHRWLVRGVVGWNQFGGPLEASESDDRVSIGFDDDFALGVEAEYRLGRRLGLELAVHRSRPTLVAHTRNDGELESWQREITVLPVTLGLDIHLTPGRRAELSLTPLIGYAFLGDLDLGEQTRLSADDSLVAGGAVTVDLALGRSLWVLSFGLRYLDADYEISADGVDLVSIELSPWTSSVGVGYRF